MILLTKLSESDFNVKVLNVIVIIYMIITIMLFIIINITNKNNLSISKLKKPLFYHIKDAETKFHGDVQQKYFVSQVLNYSTKDIYNINKKL